MKKWRKKCFISALLLSMVLCFDSIDSYADGDGTQVPEVEKSQDSTGSEESKDTLISGQQPEEEIETAESDGLLEIPSANSDQESVYGTVEAYAVQTGWVTSGGSTYYYDETGNPVCDTGLKIDGYWYYFGSDGAMYQAEWRENRTGKYSK